MMNKHRYVAWVALPFIVAFASAPCHAGELFGGRVEASGAMRGGWQYLEADSGAFSPLDTQTESGFQRIRFNLILDITISDRISAYIDIAEEPNDFGNIDPFSMTNDLAYIDYALTDYLTIRGGGDCHQYRELPGLLGWCTGRW